ncbi:unnamed protein product [Adineta ricciae]|uniref:G-protein coupled receptors family 1 profile domain-containing protein n=1 Tax=Adineta ricciae TaxID=249248 RepID=A0A813QKJ1_ADIRI|nr:unnamed protein product [Adineta ricciae]
MSNLNATISFLNALSLVQTNISIYGYSVILIVGNIGSVLNVFVLTRRQYLQNSCSCYILASTVTNLIILNVVVLFRLLTGFDIDPSRTSAFFCKFRTYIVQMTTALSRIYIVLACIDRWAMTSTVVRRRSFTNRKVPKILIPIVAIVCGLSFIHIPFYYDIIRSRCTTTSNSYLQFYNIFNTVLSGVTIPIPMIIFSILTVRNVKRLQHRVDNNTLLTERIIPNNIVNKRHHDYQLFYMIFIQQCVYIITTLPFVSYLLYITITMYSVKSPVQTSIDNLYMTVVFTFVHVNFAATFYIYVLISHTFRKDLKRSLLRGRLITWISGNQQNRITVASVPLEINLPPRT